ncbi:MAG TPA: NACHT domain-containing protein [Roseiflexaceae bacterium]
MMSDATDTRDQQIAALETALKLPLPEDTRQRLMADLRALRVAEAPALSAAVRGAVDVAGEARIDVVVGVNLGRIIYGRDPREDERRQLVWYLQTLAAKLYRLPLRGLDERLDRGDGLALPRVYVALATTAKRLAVQAVEAHPHLILLGEPGSGKSTFLRHLAWALAQCVLDPERGQALLSDNDQRRVQLPIVLPLRTLAERVDRDGLDDKVVTAALAAVLRDYGSDQGEALLRDALHSGAALLLFDGLDEVPLTAIRGTTTDRVTVVQAVRAFCLTYPAVHAVITCRTRAFDTRFQDMLGWPVETLARFTRGQMRAFAEAWYAELATSGQAEPAQAGRLTASLLGVVKDSPKLSAMAGTPLLLTMMALVLYNKGELPRDRPQLYERVLELLLGQWDKVRDGQSLAEAIGLPDWDSKRIRPLLDQLSYQAHLKASSRDGRGRLARGMVHDALIDFFKQADLSEPQAWAAAGRCLDYFNQRSGLLVPDDAQDSYVFVHLTLQEHCAGRYIVLGPDAAELVLRYRADDRWREPIFLGLGVAQQYNPALIDRVLSDLIDRQEGNTDKPEERWWRDLLLADEIGQDRDWSYLRALRINVERLQRDLKRGLQACLALPLARDSRLQAGATLGRLGDPRAPIMVEDWQRELRQRNEDFGKPAGYWCYVRDGTYIIGGWEEDKPAAKLTLPAFWIARFPIAVAQYRPFVEVGYAADAKRWWTPNGWRWKKARLRTQPWGWNESPNNGPNQPLLDYQKQPYATSQRLGGPSAPPAHRRRPAGRAATARRRQ